MTKKQESRLPLARLQGNNVQVFISHSHMDKSFLTLICDFLKTSELIKQEIRCTGVPGHGFMMGQKIEPSIKKEIKKSKIVIGVFTKESLKSQNVMLELGAGWGFGKVLIPILGPGVKVSHLPTWLQTGHWMEWTSKECWMKFEGLLEKHCGKRINNKERFDEIIEELVNWKP